MLLRPRPEQDGIAVNVHNEIVGLDPERLAAYHALGSDNYAALRLARVVVFGARTARVVEDLKISELIGRAPWREAVTYRNTWPHEYILSHKDGQHELFELVCARFRAGEGISGTFYGRPSTYLFIGDYKYWLMTHWDAVNLDDGQDYVLNRARLYRDRRDFVIQTGDTGRHEDYPDRPAVAGRSAD